MHIRMAIGMFERIKYFQIEIDMWAYGVVILLLVRDNILNYFQFALALFFIILFVK